MPSEGGERLERSRDWIEAKRDRLTERLHGRAELRLDKVEKRVDAANDKLGARSASSRLPAFIQCASGFTKTW